LVLRCRAESLNTLALVAPRRAGFTRAKRAGVTSASPLGQLTGVDPLAPSELALGAGLARLVAAEKSQLLLGAECSSRWPSRGVVVVIHVTILVTRNRLGGVGCSHWSLVSLASPL